MRSRTSTSAPEEKPPATEEPKTETVVADGARPSRRRSQKSADPDEAPDMSTELQSGDMIVTRPGDDVVAVVAKERANADYGKFGEPTDEEKARMERSSTYGKEESDEKRKIEDLRVGAGFDAIIDTLFVFDSKESYERIQGFLVSSKKASRQDYGSLLDALDEAAEVSRIALQLVANAVVARENFESEAEVIAATLRESAIEDLKRTGDKITNDAADARMKVLHHDEVRSLAERRAKAKQTVVYLEGLAKVATERQRDLRQMVATSSKS